MHSLSNKAEVDLTALPRKNSAYMRVIIGIVHVLANGLPISTYIALGRLVRKHPREGKSLTARQSGSDFLYKLSKGET